MTIINEILIAENLINGKNINEKNLYQHCDTLVRYWLQQGLTSLEVRDKVFEWATQYHIHLDKEKLNLNRIIFSAKKDKRKLRGNIVVGISSK